MGCAVSTARLGQLSLPVLRPVGRVSPQIDTRIGVVKQRIEDLAIVGGHIRHLDLPHRQLITFVKDRPGHDWRYAIDAVKVRRHLNWTPKVGFRVGLRKVAEWCQMHSSWARDAVSRDRSMRLVAMRVGQVQVALTTALNEKARGAIVQDFLVTGGLNLCTRVPPERQCL
jgi:hypothetical protein